MCCGIRRQGAIEAGIRANFNASFVRSESERLIKTKSLWRIERAGLHVETRDWAGKSLCLCKANHSAPKPLAGCGWNQTEKTQFTCAGCLEIQFYKTDSIP